MVRAWNKQRKFTETAPHRKALAKRYNPPKFHRKTWYCKNSDFGYQMAKGIYWSERFHPRPVVEYSGWSLQG